MSHYKILGVPRNASVAAIRAAYLQKAKRYHPDVNQSPQADKLFKAVQEAYQVLTEDAKRGNFSHPEPEAPEGVTTKKKKKSKFKGKVYNPEQERADFEKEFYQQAEALRKEMEVRSRTWMIFDLKISARSSRSRVY
ncbi:chaperone protein DnaJ 2-like [Condylostylus longicornis]|uniref:chaperone protein DnaJ 2-like n=1 Tax=Condylostylus longicornis TaxID=2530218 RepID=UPI00244DD1B6|nr:chaperone protein DnaJ 2-like [Condylostylus longicornis]